MGLIDINLCSGRRFSHFSTMDTWIRSKRREIGKPSFCIAMLFATAAGSFAEEAPADPPPAKDATTFADPVSTYRAYIDAVRKTDSAAAKSCFIIRDEHDARALDIMIGLWISTRRLNQIAVKKFGAEAARANLEDYGLNREDLTDAALDLTEARLTGAVVRFPDNDTAQLVIKWQEDDDNAAFEYRGDEPIAFRKKAGAWKMDGKGDEDHSGAEFPEEGTWAAAFRDHVIIANEAAERLTTNTLNSPQALKGFLDQKISASKTRYEEAVIKRHRKGGTGEK